MANNILDIYTKTPPDSSKANRLGVDKTPIDNQKEPFPKSKDLMSTDLSIARKGELGSVPNPPVGFKAPGFTPGDGEYSKKVVKNPK
jgi:hypothetical protein